MDLTGVFLGFQVGYGTIFFWIFHSELYAGVYRFEVLEELVAMFCLLDNKGIIHIPKPKPGWNGGRADGFGFKLFHEQVCN